MAQGAFGDGRLHFVDHLVSREHRFSLGIEARSGQPYVSIPVSNQMVDYEEHYAIDRSTIQVARDVAVYIGCWRKNRVHASSLLPRSAPVPPR